jgi:hypothetical protein
MFTNNLIVLLKLLKDYNLEIEEIIRNNNKEFNNEDLSVLIENIMIDLKDLDRNLN